MRSISFFPQTSLRFAAYQGGPAQSPIGVQR